MLRNGAFVAEARRELHASTHGQPVDETSLRAMVAALAEGPALTSFLTDLRQALLAWHGHVLTRAQDHVVPKETSLGHQQTRFRELRRWCDQGIPEDAWGQLRWLYGALRIVMSEKNLSKGTVCFVLPEQRLANGRRLARGLWCAKAEQERRWGQVGVHRWP